jgi:hypothetical protein
MHAVTRSIVFLPIFLCLMCFTVLGQEVEKQVLIGDPNVSSTGRARIIGKISGKEERAGLFSATVAVRGTSSGAVTDREGNYEFSITPGDYVFVVQYLGKRTRFVAVRVVGNGRFDLSLMDESVDLEDVTIEGDAADRNVAAISAGVNKVRIQDIESLPAFMGEIDVIQSLQTLPGVATVGEGAAGFNVRGGRTDQNLILQDGAIMFNANHVLGFFSSFNPDATETFTLYKGNMPAQYGGRVSSVLDVRMKEGNSERIKVKGGLGMVASRLSVEGPLSKGNTRIMISGRASYSDWVLRQTNNIDVINSDVNFHDFNIKISQKIADSHKITASYYKSGDYFKFADDFGFQWRTNLLNLNWRWSIGDKLVSSTRFIVGDYASQLFDPSGPDAAEVDNGMAYLQGNQTFFYNPNDNHNITFGADWVGYDAHPEIANPIGEKSGIQADRVEKEQGNEFGFFINDQIEVSSRFGISLGLRYSFFHNVGPYNVYQYAEGEDRSIDNIIDTIAYGKGDLIKSYGGFEPRLGLRYKLNETTSLKASINRTRQYIHTLSNTTAATPTDILQLSNTYFQPLISNNYSLGYFKNYKDNAWEFSVEGYYRSMDNLLDYKDFVDLLLNDHLETDVLAGNGRAYGMELYIRKTKGKMTGWLAYTLSRTEIQMDGGSDETTLNNGNWYPTNFDRTHNFSWVSSLTLRGTSSFNWNVIYATGRPINAIESNYQVGSTVIPHFSERNQYRIPNYFRVDVSFTFGRDILTEEKRIKRADKRYEGTLTIGIYNLLGRRNAFSVFFKRPEDFGTLPRPHRLSVLGSAFPNITYNFKF